MRRLLLALALAGFGGPSASACSSPTATSVGSPTAAEGVDASDNEIASLWTPVKRARSIPHGTQVRSLALSPGATAAVTIDASHRLLLWPTLDGSADPVDPKLASVAKAAVARAGSSIVIAALDSVGSVRIVNVGGDGRAVEVFAGKPMAPNSDLVVLAKTGITAILAADRSIRLRASDGREVAKFDERGFQPLKLYVAGANLLGALEVAVNDPNLTLRIRLFSVEQGQAGKTTIAPRGEPHEVNIAVTVPDASIGALSPGGKRFAIMTRDSAKNTSGVLVVDLAKKTSVTTDLGFVQQQQMQAALGFVDDTDVVVALPQRTGTLRIDGKSNSGVAKALPVWSNSLVVPRAVGHNTVVSIHGNGLHVYDAKRRQARFMAYQTFRPGRGHSSPSSKHYVYPSGENLFLFDRAKDELRRQQIDAAEFALHSAYFLDDDTLLLMSTSGGLRLLDRDSGEITQRLPGTGSFGISALDPVHQRFIVGGAGVQTWFYEFVDERLVGPFVVADGATRLGFLDGEQALWTIDSSNVLRTYSLAELRHGVGRASARDRGRRLVGPTPLALTRSGMLVASFSLNGSRVGWFDIGGPTLFGAASVVAGETPAQASRYLKLEMNDKIPSVAIRTHSAFTSPDGRQVAMFSDRSLSVFAIENSEAMVTIPLAGAKGGVDWDRQSRVLSFESSGGIGFVDTRSEEMVHLNCGPLFVVTVDEPPPSSPTGSAICHGP